MHKFLGGGRLVLVAGLAVFLSAKIFFILAQTAAMGMPRLGDDAFTHLWRATQIGEVGLLGALRGDGDVAYRGSADIATLCRTDTQATSTSRALCARVADNTAGADVKAGASLLLNATLHTGLSWKWTYALFETVIAVILGLSIAYFLVRLAGPAAAGVGLILLAFMTLLPPQGLHQFVASTLAVALSLALWGLVIRRESPYLYAAAIAGAGILSLIHPVALVYGAGLALFAIHAFRRELTPIRLAMIAGAALAVLLILLSFPNPVRHVLAEATSADLRNVAIANLQAVPERFAVFATENAGIVAAVILSLLVARRIIDGWFMAAAGTLLLLLTASLFYNMEFFTFAIPLDLFARVFIGVAVLGCGLIGATLAALWRDGSRLRRTAILFVIPLLLLPSFLAWRTSIYANINGRGEVIDEHLLKSTVSSLNASAALAYGELEISPTAVFLAGGSDRGAIPITSLSPEALGRALDDRRPAALILPNYHVLNSLAVAQSHSLARRRYGLPAALVSAVAIRATGAPIVTLHVRVENDTDQRVTIGPIRYTPDRGPQQLLSNVIVPAHSRAWIPIQVGQFLPARTVSLDLPSSGAWITGLAINDPPRDGVAWPWDASAILNWQRRDLPQANPMQVVFSVSQLFAYWNPKSGNTPPRLPNLRSVISDESGLVFVATDYPPQPSQN